jgi:hypothetical protein
MDSDYGQMNSPKDSHETDRLNGTSYPAPDRERHTLTLGMISIILGTVGLFIIGVKLNIM